MATIYVLMLLLKLVISSHQEQCVISKYEDVESVISNCTDIAIDDLIVPSATTLTLNLQEGTKVTLRGNISFEFGYWSGPVVLIAGSSLTVVGEPGAVFDGQGERYWDGQGTWSTFEKPRFLRIEARDSMFSNIKILNCPVACSKINVSSNVIIDNWTIDNLAGDEGVAPPQKFAHNTDGIQVRASTNVTITNSSISNQDDCVAINSGSNFLVEGLYCHGGHGLSISVGFENATFAENSVDNVTIRNCALVNGENGIHIKTHADATNGRISNVLYENINFEGPVLYGINIQQNYRNLPANGTMDPTPVGNIPIVNLTFRNIVGKVAASAVPVYIICADGACLNFDWHNVSVTGIKPNDCNFNPEGYKC
ncbi:polygalacturonase-like [Cylas formicarius]|uniref:polygalacturonase-like n=1 Tax=Cylas formicarius TaxID=197179 RepID=UPI002958B426|nr:polygalacturonase-like [Cylas formicarius]